MPVPTQPADPAYASESLANSMSPGIAKAVGIGYLESSDQDAEVLQVSPDNPFPVGIDGTVTIEGEVSGNWLTDTELRATPVPVYEDPREIQTTSFSTFTSTTAAVIYGADLNRYGALIFVPETSPPLHIRWGSISVSSTTRSYTIQPGGAYQVPKEFAGVALYGIMDSAGSAYITQFSIQGAG